MINLPNQQLYHDYINGELVPYMYVLTFEYDEIDWDEKTYYFDLIKPFDCYEDYYYDESILSVSILITDLIVNDNHPNQLGINLISLKERIEKYGVEAYSVRRFVMQLPDVSEVLELLPNKRRMAFIIND